MNNTPEREALIEQVRKTLCGFTIGVSTKSEAKQIIALVEQALSDNYKSRVIEAVDNLLPHIVGVYREDIKEAINKAFEPQE